jgi:hypothetical protein
MLGVLGHAERLTDMSTIAGWAPFCVRGNDMTDAILLAAVTFLLLVTIG